MRNFSSGATRDTDTTKPDYEGYLSPEVLHRYGEYMTAHRKQADGQLRDSDNWQKGIPRQAYMKSLVRHTFDLWRLYRKGRNRSLNGPTSKEIEDLLCAVMFNAMGFMHEWLLGRDVEETPATLTPGPIISVKSAVLDFRSWQLKHNGSCSSTCKYCPDEYQSYLRVVRGDAK